MRTRTVLFWLSATVILIVLAILVIPRFRKPEPAVTLPDWPTQEWRISTPEEQGFDSAKLADGLLAIQEQNINIDSLLIIRNGSVILDAYYYPYDGSIPHDLASVTKSIITTLIGIAADQGKIQLDQPMLSFFPDRDIANLDSRKESITVRHLAGMVNGFGSGCMGEDEATIDKMRAGPDWVQAALDRKMVQEPGEGFCYDSPGMHILSAILQESTGMTALDFARQYLFEPLGIHDVAWESDPQGYTHGWGDLHMKPRDMAKIGYLWLNNGVWDGRQIVSPDWVQASVKPQIQTGRDAYGYGWWVSSDDYYAFGRGGQTIHINPSMKAIVVTTGAGMEYDQVIPFVLDALVDPEQAIPQNPEGTARLNDALAEIMQPAELPVSIPMPGIARTVSGRVYVFEPNPLEVESLSVGFDNPSQATIRLKLENSDTAVEGPIGLDGRYRLASNGWGLRGHWSGPKTFIFEIFDIGQFPVQLSFEEEHVVLDAFGTQIEGRVENP